MVKMKNPDENNYVTDIVGATVIMTRELADYATTVEKPYNQLEFGVIITRLGSVQVDIYEKPDQYP